MKQIKLLFEFDVKSMGYLFFIPIFLWALLAFLFLITAMEVKPFYQIVQFIFIPSSGWWIVYRYSELLEDGARETLFPLYKEYLLTDIIRYYAIVVLEIIFLFLFYNNAGSLQWELIIYSLLLGLNFLILGTLLILWTRNIELSIGLIAIYTLVEFVTNGQLIPWPHFFYNFDSLVMSNIYIGYALNVTSIIASGAIIRFKLLKY